MDRNIHDVDRANLSAAATAVLELGDFPPLPVIESVAWYPPNQTDPVTYATTPDHIRIWANADSHDWQEMMIDTPGGEGAAAGQVMSYWDGNGAADYVMTLRHFWQLVPGSYTRVYPGGHYSHSLSTTVGISETDETTLAASLNVGVDGIGAEISAEFKNSVTTSVETQQTATYDVDGPDEGVRVWMLWQLVDEICALDPAGNVIANQTRHADVNWSEHAPSGAYVNYQNVDQTFPSATLVPMTKDFPASR